MKKHPFVAFNDNNNNNNCQDIIKQAFQLSEDNFKSREKILEKTCY